MNVEAQPSGSVPVTAVVELTHGAQAGLSSFLQGSGLQARSLRWMGSDICHGGEEATSGWASGAGRG